MSTLHTSKYEYTSQGSLGNDVEMLGATDDWPREKNQLDLIFEEDYERLSPELQHKVSEWRDAIQPHTEEGGNAYYIGDVYEPIDPICVREWRLLNPRAYLRYVKRLAMQIPTLDYLAHWMEVSTSPLKWKFLRRHPASRAERAQRVQACVIDYNENRLLRSKLCETADSLQQALQQDKYVGEGEKETCRLRLIIVEDLSRDLIELLGATYDIDPRFFRDFINDYLFYNIRDRWAQVPSLLLEDQIKPFSTFSFLRARYYADEEEYHSAERQMGMFNVLRRPDFDRIRTKLQVGLLDRENASVSLVRSKVGIWTREASIEEDDGPGIAILLTDPTLRAGKPLWGGIEISSGNLSMRNNTPDESILPQGASLFEQVIHTSSLLSPEDLTRIADDVHCAGIPMYTLVLKEWLIAIQYMKSRAGLIRWELERPRFGADAADSENLLRKLGPWQRNIGYYENMVGDGMRQFLPSFSSSSSSSSPPPHHYQEGEEEKEKKRKKEKNKEGKTRETLRPDFLRLQEQLSRTRERFDQVASTLAPFIAKEDALRNTKAMQESRGLTFLSILATIFLPLNFAASFFSMSGDFSARSDTVWLFFVVGVPLTGAMVGLVAFFQPRLRGRVAEFVRGLWRGGRKRG